MVRAGRRQARPLSDGPRRNDDGARAPACVSSRAGLHEEGKRGEERSELWDGSSRPLHPALNLKRLVKTVPAIVSPGPASVVRRSLHARSGVTCRFETKGVVPHVDGGQADQVSLDALCHPPASPPSARLTAIMSRSRRAAATQTRSNSNMSTFPTL